MAKMGRPTDYSEELARKAWDYLDDFETIYGHGIPSHLGLCEALSINKTTLYRWAEDSSKEIRAILDECMARQHNLLIAKGLNGTFNASIAKLVLGKHNYHDRLESTGADGGAIKTDTTWTIKVIEPV